MNVLFVLYSLQRVFSLLCTHVLLIKIGFPDFSNAYLKGCGNIQWFKLVME